MKTVLILCLLLAGCASPATPTDTLARMASGSATTLRIAAQLHEEGRLPPVTYGQLLAYNEGEFQIKLAAEVQAAKSDMTATASPALVGSLAALRAILAPFL